MMLNPTRRIRRPPNNRLVGTNSPVQSSPRRRRVVSKTDAVRGTIFLALVVVTIVLYAILWEWERHPSTFTVPSPNLPNRNAAVSLSSPSSLMHNGPSLSSTKGPNPTSSKPDHPTVRTTRQLLNTRFPDQTHDADPLPNVEDRAAENNVDSFDSTYCNGACRFLLPVRIGEQESKSRIHLTQLVSLAQRLGRTLVLPNVGQSRMGACAKWPFSAYYDTNGLLERGIDDPGNPLQLAIDLNRFAHWVDERPTPPTGIIVSMHQHSAQEELSDVWGTQLEFLDDAQLIAETIDVVDPKILSCLDSKLPRLRFALSKLGLSISIERKPSLSANISNRLMQVLSSNSLYLDPESDLDWMAGPGYDFTSQYHANASSLPLAELDVLALDYDLRHSVFAVSDSTQQDVKLHYSPVLYDLADRLADNLGPFLAIHWRMENVPVQNLAWCAASLVSVLHALLQNDDDSTGKHVRYVWLATDHPLPLSAITEMRAFVDERSTLNKRSDNGRRRRGAMKSSTFKALSPEHDDAIRTLAEAFQSGGDLEAWSLTDLAEQLSIYPYVEGRLADMVDEALLEDSGVLGILDKLVVVQASVFVSGSAECSKTSSFSRQVIEARQESFEAEQGKGTTRNVVEYFGKW